MHSTIFTNDDNARVLLLPHRFSVNLQRRNEHEIVFRRINTFLIKNKIIKNNIIDLGAWIGDNSIPWAINIDGVVYAIDPSPDNCEFIKRTGELNKLSNIQVIQSAISDINEVLSTNENINHCSFVYGNTGMNGINKVYAVSLDYLYSIRTIKNIGYIHLDVEGMEYKILKGSSTLIDECRPIISFEQHLEIDDYNVIVSYLRCKKYVVFLLNEVLPGCRPDCRNSFAFPEEVYSEELIRKIHSFIGNDVLINKS